MNDRCEYHGCDRPKDSLDGIHCVFHAEAENKGLTAEEYKERFDREIARLESTILPYDFSGFIFTFPVDFTGKEFIRAVDFRDARFEGQKSVEYKHPNRIKVCAVFNRTKFRKDAIFKSAKFLGGAADFRCAEFSGRSTLFFDTQFIGGEALFSHSKFLDSYVDFIEARFLSKKALFDNVVFEFGPTFHKAKFHCSKTTFFNMTCNKGTTDFSNTEFNCDFLYFNNANFSGNSLNFFATTFETGVVYFRGVTFDVAEVNFNSLFKDGNIQIFESYFKGSLIFDNPIIHGFISLGDITFSEKSRFILRNPDFGSKKWTFPSLRFYKISFNPFRTYFENVDYNLDQLEIEYIDSPLIAFRQCHLKDVYFAESNMALFSFYRSAFYEEALFSSYYWPPKKEKIIGIMPLIKFMRKYQIREDLIYNDIRIDKMQNANESNHMESGVGFPRNYSEVAEIYLHLKTAADRAKDYHLASNFYFNEFEMKRRHILERAKSKKWWKAVPDYLWFTLHSTYKLFSGYGERPFWSLIWFGICSFIFAGLHLLNGIKNDAGNKIDYALIKSFSDFPKLYDTYMSKEFWGDFFDALKFSLHHALPISYLPYLKEKFSLVDHGFWSTLLSLSNSILLILLIIFIGVGLKRHFRRF